MGSSIHPGMGPQVLEPKNANFEMGIKCVSSISWTHILDSQKTHQTTGISRGCQRESPTH